MVRPRAYSPVFLSGSILFAVLSFLLVQTFYKWEEWLAGTIPSVDLARIAMQTFTQHASSLFLWVILVVSVAMWIGRIYDKMKRELAARVLVSESLRERQEVLTRILDTVADGIYMVDRFGHITYANPAAESIFGVSRDELPSLAFDDAKWKLTTPDGRPFPPDRQPFTQVTRTERPVYGIEQSFERPDGRRVIVSINAAPLHDSSGMLTGEVATLDDITLRKQAEEALRQSEAKNRALLDALPDALLRLSRDGTLLGFQGAKDSTPWTRLDTSTGWKVNRIFPSPVGDQIMRHLDLAIKSRSPQMFEYQMTVDGDLRDREARLVAVGPDEAMMLVRDITARKAVDRMKNEFISTVSHELRTPLTSISGSLGLLAGGVTGELPTQAKALVEIALKNSQRLVRLINDILDIEKIEAGKIIFNFRPIQIVPLLEQAIEANRAFAAGFGAQLVLKAIGLDLVVNADSDRLTQVITNLLSNASKFSPRGGRVTVSVERYAGAVRVRIHDQGAGIPDVFRNQIFQRFAQADSSDSRQKDGTGLGLSISKAIVEKHGGTIGFESEPGAGTCFYFDLPEWHSAFSSPAPQGQPAPRILICEDDPDIATLLRMMLEQGGLCADVSYTAAQAKQFLAENSYDGMTLDLALPGQDGISLLRELRQQERTRCLPIIVVSVQANQGKAEWNGDAFSVVDWIDKPIDQTRLIAAVRQGVARTADKPRVLHVEDDSDVRAVVGTLLQDTAMVEHAATVKDAARRIEQNVYHLVLLDLALPDGSGLELLPLLHRRNPTTPVVVFSAQEMDQRVAPQVAAALVKARTSNEKLLETIKTFVRRG